MTRKQRLRWVLYHARHLEEAAACVYIDIDEWGYGDRPMRFAAADARRAARHLTKLLAHLAAAREGER